MIIFLIVFNVALVAVISLYCKLTCGINKCSHHLFGKVVIVTGGNAGIGFETAKDLAARGARVIIGCRNEGRGTVARDKIIAATENKDVHYRHLDLASPTSIRKFAEDIIKTEKRLDILINNAGILESKNLKTEDGLSLAMQTNHFGPFLLTNLLLPLLKSSAPSRIINVSSMAYRKGEIDFHNLNMEKENEKTYSMSQMYSNTKLCNVLMTVELERQLQGTGVTANCLHPGFVETSISDGVDSSWLNWLKSFPMLSLITKSAWEGAQTSIFLAVAPEVKDISGCYFVDCRLSKVTESAKDPELAKKLWEVSERIVKIK